MKDSPPCLQPEAIRAKFSSDDELEEFWTSNRHSYRFCATGNELSPSILSEDEWVFGRTREAVVKAVLCWEENQIRRMWEADEDGGWWRLSNLPFGHTEESLFENMLGVLDDPNMGEDEVAREKQLQIFEHWEIDTTSPVCAFNKARMNNRFPLPPWHEKNFACEISMPFPATQHKRKKRRESKT